MSYLPTEFTHQQRLRLKAEGRLKNGTAATSKGFTLGVDALAVLYQLASSPESAAEGLKLLHELQTHQVELDLQNEQLAANEHDIAKSFSYYQGLFDFAPIGYFVAGLDGQILESNLACAELFEVESNEFSGRHFDSLLRPESRSMFFRLLKRLLEQGTRESCVVQSDHAFGGRTLQINARCAPGGQHLLILVSELDKSMNA